MLCVCSIMLVIQELDTLQVAAPYMHKFFLLHFYQVQFSQLQLCNCKCNTFIWILLVSVLV
jgi:hypothetical protein